MNFQKKVKNGDLGPLQTTNNNLRETMSIREKP